MAYILIDATDYTAITGRVGSECTEARENLACYLVNSVLGRNSIEDTVWEDNQTDALEYSVAMFIKYLYLNADSPPDTRGFRLGKFETPGSGTISMSEIFFAYMRLKREACINWRVYNNAYGSVDYA